MTDETAPVSILTHPFSRMGQYPNGAARPVHVRLRELDFAFDGSELKFFFWGGADILLTGGDAEFAALIDRVCEPGYASTTPAPALKADWGTPLSLQNGELAYVVYRLRRGRNWEFAECGGLPFSVGGKGHPFCYDAYRAWTYQDKDQGESERTGCFVGYFIADGRTPKEPTGRYDFAINVHVDLLFAGGRRMPIIIDPDVRYPGGSGSDNP